MAIASNDKLIKYTDVRQAYTAWMDKQNLKKQAESRLFRPNLTDPMGSACNPPIIRPETAQKLRNAVDRVNQLVLLEEEFYG